MPVTQIILASVAIFILTQLFGKKEAVKDPEYQKFVAFHEAGHAVMALFQGFRCQGLILNITQDGRQINPELKQAHGAALIDTSLFRSELEIIKNSTLINLDTSLLPSSEEVILYAKRYLVMLYAGDLIVKKLFDVPDHYLGIMNTGITRRGEDLHTIQNLHDYLEKVGHPLSPEDAQTIVFKVYDDYKEVRAAIHFLADAMLKNPGQMISEREIIDNLSTVNFFAMISRESSLIPLKQQKST